MTKPRDHPILFNTWSVQRILSGCKVQTRRVLKVPNPETIKVEGGMIYHRPSTLEGEPVGPWYRWQAATQSPYGTVGSHIWIRETWGGIFETKNERDRVILLQWRDTSKELRTEENCECLFYKATDDSPDYEGCWAPSMFMPKWASRILLEIDEVRVQRVQDISWDDAIAEGIEERPEGSGWYHGPSSSWRSPISAFAELWNSINTRHDRVKRGFSWEDNPWLWCLTFHILERRDES